MSGHFKAGDRIMWTYIHATNSRTRIRRYKPGTFIRYARKNVVIALDGNTRYSYVKEADLQSALVVAS